jgi:hypothetical protein
LARFISARSAPSTSGIQSCSGAGVEAAVGISVGSGGRTRMELPATTVIAGSPAESETALPPPGLKVCPGILCAVSGVVEIPRGSSSDRRTLMLSWQARDTIRTKTSRAAARVLKRVNSPLIRQTQGEFYTRREARGIGEIPYSRVTSTPPAGKPDIPSRRFLLPPR